MKCWIEEVQKSSNVISQNIFREDNCGSNVAFFQAEIWYGTVNVNLLVNIHHHKRGCACHMAPHTEFHLFLGCNNPLAFHQHTHELSQGQQSDRGWTRTASIKWFQICFLRTHIKGRHSWSGVSLGHLPGRSWTFWTISTCYQTPLDHADGQLASSLIGSTLSLTLRETLSHHDTEKGATFFWCGHPQSLPKRPLCSSVSRTRHRTLNMAP